MGAEDGDARLAKVRSGAADGHVVAPRRGGRGRWVRARGVWIARQLEGEGVFEFFHPGLQILDFSLLFFQEQIFYALKSGSHLGAQGSHIFLDLFGERERFVSYFR
jgi:hypothetical protein